MPVAADSLTQSPTLRIEFHAEAGTVPEPSVYLFASRRFPHLSGLSYRIDDSKTGNGDGLIQVQEAVELNLTAQNHGQGDGQALVATLRASPEAPRRRLFIRRGRIKSDPISVGETKEFRFKFRVKGNHPVEIPVRIGIGDPKIGAFAVRTLTIASVGAMKRLSTNDVYLRPSAGVSIQLHAQPHRSLQSWLGPGSTIGRSGMSGWYRVPLDDGTFGWADSALLKQAEGASVVTSSQRTQIQDPFSSESRAKTN